MKKIYTLLIIFSSHIASANNAALPYHLNCTITDALYGYPSNYSKPKIGSNIEIYPAILAGESILNFKENGQTQKYELEGKLISDFDHTYSYSKTSDHVDECGYVFIQHLTKLAFINDRLIIDQFYILDDECVNRSRKFSDHIELNCTSVPF